MDFCMKLLKAEWKVNQQEGEKESKCYTTSISQWWWLCCTQTGGWGQRGNYEDTEKGCQKPAVQQNTTDYDDDFVVDQWNNFMLILFFFGSSHVLTPVSLQCVESRTFSLCLRLVSTKSEMSWLVSCLDTSVLANVSVSEKMSRLQHWY